MTTRRRASDPAQLDLFAPPPPAAPEPTSPAASAPVEPQLTSRRAAQRTELLAEAAAAAHVYGTRPDARRRWRLLCLRHPNLVEEWSIANGR